MGDFEVTNGTLTVRRDLSWELDKEFDRHCEELLASGADELVLDLTDVGFVFSPCVSRIVKLFGGAQEAGKSLRILISPKLEDLFEMSGLRDEMNVEIIE